MMTTPNILRSNVRKPGDLKNYVLVIKEKDDTGGKEHKVRKVSFNNRKQCLKAKSPVGKLLKEALTKKQDDDIDKVDITPAKKIKLNVISSKLSNANSNETELANKSQSEHDRTKCDASVSTMTQTDNLTSTNKKNTTKEGSLKCKSNIVTQNISPKKVLVTLKKNGGPVIVGPTNTPTANPPPLLIYQPIANPLINPTVVGSQTTTDTPQNPQGIKILSKVDLKAIPSGASVKILPTNNTILTAPAQTVLAPAQTVLAPAQTVLAPAPTVLANTPNKTTPNQPVKRTPSQQQEKQKLVAPSKSNKVDLVEMFVDLIEEKMAKLPTQQRLHAENLINQVLYNGQLKLLSSKTKIGNTNINMSGNIVVLKKTS